MFDNGSSATSRIIIFATSECLKHLAGSQKWFMDGNFAVAPKLFMQVNFVVVLLFYNVL